MKTKEKLELLWKYLLLLVLAIGVFRFTSNDYKDHDVMLFGDEDLAMDVEVEKNIINGDTVMTVMVNGKEVDADEFKMEGETMQWRSKEGCKIKLHFDNEDEDHKNRKVITKHIEIRTNGNKRPIGKLELV